MLVSTFLFLSVGKTIAFLIPLIERVLAHNSSLPRASSPRPVRALVISPTRELAQQIEEEARRLGKFHGIRLACCVGGLPIARDLRALQQGSGLHLVIATPGRLKDLLQNQSGIVQSFSDMCFLVLDEADRLLDMGFKPGQSQNQFRQALNEQNESKRTRTRTLAHLILPFFSALLQTWTPSSPCCPDAIVDRLCSSPPLSRPTSLK